MTTLFFLYSLLVGWLAYNVYHPIYRLPHGAALSFLTGWLVGELALHHIALQMFVVFLFVWGGAVEGFWGGVGLLVCVGSWLALGYFHITGERAAPAVEQALSSALGQGYQDAISDDWKAMFPSGPDAKSIWMPFSPIDFRVEVIKNIKFGNHEQRLDIYRPRDEVGKAPILFQIHGGAWTENMGSKDGQALPLMAHMARRGWISVSADYRLGPTATFPEHIIDCKEAFKWIKENIAEYGGDPDFIVVTGGSAGGHLCALFALSANDPAYQPGFEDLDTTVQGAIPFYGVYDLTNSGGSQHHNSQQQLFETSLMKLPRDANISAYQSASPLFRIDESAPPFFIIHGGKDTLVPVEEARLFAEKLRGVSRNPVAYAEIEGAQHAFDMFASPEANTSNWASSDSSPGSAQRNVETASSLSVINSSRAA